MPQIGDTERRSNSIAQIAEGLLDGGPVTSHAIAAIAWIIGIAVACYLWSIHLYNQRRAAEPP